MPNYTLPKKTGTKLTEEEKQKISASPTSQLTSKVKANEEAFKIMAAEEKAKLEETALLAKIKYGYAIGKTPDATTKDSLRANQEYEMVKKVSTRKGK